MAGNHITDFITKFGGGTRQNRFLVSGSIGGRGTTKFSDFTKNQIHVRAASLPASTISVIPVNWRGRTVNYPGDRVYSPWQITVLDDKPKGKERLFEAFHAWSNEINDHGTNVSKSLDLKNHFSTDWSVSHLDTNGNTTNKRNFILKNCWPITIGEISLDMGADNTLVSFAVGIAYSHFEYDAVT